MITADPALRFWLDYTAHEGAVYEEDGDGAALVVLPEHLQVALDVPETVVVTTDPDVAREEGASLLIPGYGPLDRAATCVLDDGDVGWSPLAWPTSEPPSPSALIGSIRDHLPVDHGRIDLAGEPTPSRWPVARVGALVTYAVSLDQRFCERDEVWVAARGGVPVPPPIADRLAEWPVAALEACPPASTESLDAAIAGAHRLLQARAERRLDALREQADGDCGAELARVDAYYEATLDSIEQRRSTAPPERRSRLDAQADVTRLERSRRVAEVREKFTPSLEVRPFRLHLLLVPALALSVDVRRGNRRYPLEVTWVLPARTLAPTPCPSCDATETLVAGRDRLGCRTCLPTRSEPPPAPVRLASSPAAEPATTEASGTRAPSTEGTRRRPPRTTVGARSPGRPRPTRRTAAPGGDRAGPSLERVGSKLADEFWGAVVHGERWPRKGKGVARQSPYETLLRVCGPEGPAVVIGSAPCHTITGLSMTTAAGTDSGLVSTTGAVLSPGGDRPFTLRWYRDGSKPVVAEVLPFSYVLDHRLPPGLSFRKLATAPRPDLDDGAAAAWRLAHDVAGLPLAVRALTAWWRLDPVERADLDPTLVATALVRLVTLRAGIRPSASPSPDVTKTARRLQALLHLSPRRAW